MCLTYTERSEICMLMYQPASDTDGMSLTYTERGKIFMLLCQPGSDTDGTHGKTINEIISNK
jgi:hypothetical protein